MNHLFHQAPFAEDQAHAHTILTTHVLYRGFQIGSLLGPLIGLSGNLYLRSRRGNARMIPLLPSIVRATGVSAVFGTGFLALALVGRMWGREEVEWQDRSWRLLGNKGQNEVDEWSAAGMVVGGVENLLAGGRGKGWKLWTGSVGLGGLVGVGGYLAWRYGVKGGKWDEESPA